MYRIIQQKITNLSLKNKITAMILALTFFLSVAALTCFGILCETYNQLLYQVYSSQMDKAASSIQSSLESAENVSFSILSNATVQENLSSLYYMDIHSEENKQIIANCLTEIYNSLHPLVSSPKLIRAIGFDINGQSLTRGLFFPNHLDMDALNKTAVSKKGVAFWYPEQTDGYRLYCIREIREMNYLKMHNLATLYVEVNFSSIVSEALADAGYEEDAKHLFLLTDNASVVYSTQDLSNASPCLSSPEFLNEMTSLQENYKICTIDHRKKFITVGTIAATGWQYIYITDYNSVFSAIRFTHFLCITIFVFCAVAVTCICSYLIVQLTRHFRILEKKMQRFGSGDLTPMPNTYDYSSRQDEIGHLHVQFDQMAQHITSLVNENYVKQMLLQETQIQTLQQQMNPHFLYNTLDSIYWMAQKDNDQTICIMVQSLANLFRASITDSSELISISSEVQFLNSYIQIQQLRFQDRLLFEQLIPSEYMRLLIPKLCIQPLVENAIHHAMENSPEVCIIRLDMAESDDTYQIRVMNTGSVFEEHLLEKLQKGEVTASGTGIGLSNIDKRFKLIYGNSYGLTLYNTASMAVVALTFPKNFRIKEKTDASSIISG